MRALHAPPLGTWGGTKLHAWMHRRKQHLAARQEHPAGVHAMHAMMALPAHLRPQVGDRDDGGRREGDAAGHPAGQAAGVPDAGGAGRARDVHDPPAAAVLGGAAHVPVGRGRAGAQQRHQAAPAVRGVAERGVAGRGTAGTRCATCLLRLRRAARLLLQGHAWITSISHLYHHACSWWCLRCCCIMHGLLPLKKCACVVGLESPGRVHAVPILLLSPIQVTPPLCAAVPQV